MLDPNQVLQHVQQHTAPPDWQVLPAKQSHFMQTLFGGVAIIVLGIAGAAYLLINPAFVIGLRGLVALDGLQNVWRIVDFVLCGAIVISGGILVRKAITGMATLEAQMLVLLPEGFVMQKGTNSKTLSAIAYANVNAPQIVVKSGTTYLMMPRANGQGAMRLELDGRFGPPKQIAKRIVDAHQLYARARAGR